MRRTGMACAVALMILLAGMSVQAGPCDDYYRCCLDFVQALRATPGANQDAVAGVAGLCGEVEAMRDDPASMDLCAGALDNMRRQATTYDRLEGFRLPASCR